MKNAVCKMMTLLLVGVTTLSGLNYSTVYANETVNDKDPIIDDISIDKQGQTVKVYDSVGEYYNTPQDLFTVSVKAHDDQSIEKVEVKIISPSDDGSIYSNGYNISTYELKWNEEAESYQCVVSGLYTYRPSMKKAYVSSVSVTDNEGNTTKASETQLYTETTTALNPKYWVGLDMYHNISLREWNETTGEMDYRSYFVKDGTTLAQIKEIYPPQNNNRGLNFKEWRAIYNAHMGQNDSIRCGYALIASYDKSIIVYRTLNNKDGKYIYTYLQSQYINTKDEIKFPKVSGYTDSDWQEGETAPDEPYGIFELPTDRTLIMPDDKINSIVDDINCGKVTGNIIIDMGEAVYAPKEILEAIKGKDINAVFKMNDGTWTINGKNLSGANDENDVNLSLLKEKYDQSDIEISDIIGKYNAERLTFGEGNYGFNSNILTTSSLADNAEKVVVIGKDENGYKLDKSEIIENSSYNVNNDFSELYAVYGKNGDCTGDGKVDIRDVIMSIHQVSGRQDINPVQQGFADIDMNNNVNIQDLIKVIHYVSGRSDEL